MTTGLTMEGKKKALCLLLLDMEERDAISTKRSHSVWVREELKRRGEHGEYATWFSEEMLNAGAFHSAFRMTPTRFEEIQELVGHRLQHENTNFREAIPPAERLAITLRWVIHYLCYLQIA